MKGISVFITSDHPNDAHHWRRASDGQHLTETESRRPMDEPGVRLTWA
jgi:hypothetical protein